MNDPTRALFERLWQAVTRGPGVLAPELRQAIAAQDSVPPALAGYLDTIRRNAYRITDDDVAALHKAGYDDEQIFEMTVCAAVGAGFQRLHAGLAALEGAS